MAARVQAVGGSFTALPAADGGFSVRAVVPVAR
ncbi:histidine kinase OS=Corynebacterium variabile OX=1727 GN=CVA01_05610 PE=4 SV=1 [Corynebacterium variabile]